MLIGGLMKTTLLDFPGNVAATVFTVGCNMRCPFCHNMNLVENTGNIELFTDDEVLNFLSSRAKLLDGVCITGGEPTLQKDLYSFISKVKNLGLKVKLDTNGTNPEMILDLSREGLIDYVAMDIKSSFSTYPDACGIDDIKLLPIKKSIDLLIGGKLAYEFRTTMINRLHTPQVMAEIGEMLDGATNYYMQGFVDSRYVPNHDFTSPTKEELLAYREKLLNHINNVEIRGID